MASLARPLGLGLVCGVRFRIQDFRSGLGSSGLGFRRPYPLPTANKVQRQMQMKASTFFEPATSKQAVENEGRGIFLWQHIPESRHV